MSLLDKLNAKLLENKERLRRLEASIDDVLKAAQQPGSEFTSDQYLAVAKDLRSEADKTRKLISRLEKLRAVERSRSQPAD